MKFEVLLQDLDVPTYHHGGGTITASPDGDIPAGALTTIRDRALPPVLIPIGSLSMPWMGVVRNRNGEQVGPISPKLKGRDRR